MKDFTNTGNWAEVLKEGLDFLNLYVKPHNLLAISLFEEDHPCPSQLYHFVIIYSEQDVSKPMGVPEDI